MFLVKGRIEEKREGAHAMKWSEKGSANTFPFPSDENGEKSVIRNCVFLLLDVS